MTGHSVEAEEELRIALVCREMRWTYQEYMAQPQWLLDTFSILREKEAAFQKTQESKVKIRK